MYLIESKYVCSFAIIALSRQKYPSTLHVVQWPITAYQRIIWNSQLHGVIKCRLPTTMKNDSNISRMI